MNIQGGISGMAASECIIHFGPIVGQQRRAWSIELRMLRFIFGPPFIPG